MQPWIAIFQTTLHKNLFIFMCLFFLNIYPAFSNSLTQKNISSLNLQHEPIQPLRQEKNLLITKVNLGKTLFNDMRLGRDNDMSCASCHQLSVNGADIKPLSLGRKGIKLDVNTLTIFNAALNHQQFWDGRALTLQNQIDFVVANKKEFANDWPTIIERLKHDTHYPKIFLQIYDDGITANNVRDAIAIFEHSLITVNSRFDLYLLGDSTAISAEEKKGYALFKSYGCVACHQGSNVGGNLFMKFGVFGDYFEERGKLTQADLGRFNVTGNEADRYVFRVPSLRLAAITPPYFHDGSVNTLKEAVKIMARYQLGRVISKKDINSIVAFLKTLPGNYNGKPLIKSQAAKLRDNKS